MTFLPKKLFLVFAMMIAALPLFGGDVVSPSPYVVFRIPGLGIPLTNAMITSWAFSLVLILLVRWAVGARPKMIPDGKQLVVESLVESMRGVLAPIVGRKVLNPAFPLLLGFFIFILAHNWSGLIPGVGTFGHYDDHGHFLYYFRPGNADLNMTLALSIISFVAWLYFIFKYAGIKTIIYDLFGNKAEKSDLAPLMYYALFLVFGCVGFIEIVSILFRLVSLSFRLFGNVFGGENLLASITGLFAYVLPVPFYFLEVLIGIIQAFVFMLLTAIYIGLICNHGDEDHAH